MAVALTELQRIPTSGARAVEPFVVDGLQLLAIPQVARDIPGQPAGMNGGDSDNTELLVLRRVEHRYVPFAALPGQGGEDAEFFTIDGRSFLAVASIRSGSGPYEFTTESVIYAWRDGGFTPFQGVTTYAAKQWRHWQIGERHFLGLAQGVKAPSHDRHDGENRPSMVYEWDGATFVEFQQIPSQWAYNWHPFQVGDTFFVAHADHLGASVLYRWDGSQLQPHQDLMASAGRAFATFQRDGGHYLVVAGLSEPPRVLRWQADRFEDFQELAGLGARELAVLDRGERLFVVRVNFILGTPADPVPSLTSQVYEWDGGGLHVVAEFPTTGGTDVAFVDGAGGPQFVVSNALSAEVRFASETVLYSLATEGGQLTPGTAAIARPATPAYESAELLGLFQAYTASATSIGAHYAELAARTSGHDPLIVATGTDIALYPGRGSAPTVEGFRLSTRGFKELAAVSHLGPALATLTAMKDRDPAGQWRWDAERLLAATRTARSANSAELWRERIAVAAFAGREPAIATMIDYACALTEGILERALADAAYLTASALRQDYLEGPSPDLPVPFNRVMVATFFLTGMDIAHRLIGWFDDLDLPWERAMVIVAGRQGRPTSGVTQETNSVAGVILAASRDRLPAHRLLIAPHAPVFPPYDGGSLDRVGALEPDYRALWSQTLATSDLGALMFDGYPAYAPPAPPDVAFGPRTPSVSELPPVTSPQDWFALTTRLRVVLEDPRQLLSGAVVDYAARQLVTAGNAAAALTVPGLDGEPYPASHGHRTAHLEPGDRP